MSRTFPRPPDQQLVSFTFRFTRARWARLRLAAAKAGTSIAVYVHNVLNEAETSMTDTNAPHAQPDMAARAAGEAAAKATTLHVLNAPDVGDPAKLDELSKRQPCAGKPGEWVPPATSFKTA